MNKLKEKIGFIGCGNMGGAILEGLLKNGIAKPNQIFIFDPLQKTRNEVRRKHKVHISFDNQEVIRKSDIVILAIKPQELRNMKNDLKVLRSRQIVITILAGTPIQKVKKFLHQNVLIARAMPNLGAKVGASITALSGNSKAVQKAEIIFSGCGVVLKVPEKYMDLVTAVSGSGPAYFFFLMEILAQFAKSKGLSEKEAVTLAVETAYGAGKLATVSLESPEVLRKRVTSKGGTTEAALSVLFKKNTPQIFKLALERAIKRAKELSRG